MHHCCAASFDLLTGHCCAASFDLSSGHCCFDLSRQICSPEGFNLFTCHCCFAGFDLFIRRCRILANNTVSCDQDIYRDYDQWETHRERLDEMIKEHKKILDDLRVSGTWCGSLK